MVYVVWSWGGCEDRLRSVGLDGCVGLLYLLWMAGEVEVVVASSVFDSLGCVRFNNKGLSSFTSSIYPPSNMLYPHVQGKPVK